METLFLIIPIALLLVLAAVLGFVWASKTGQFDDLSTPAYRALLDDEQRAPTRKVADD